MNNNGPDSPHAYDDKQRVSTVYVENRIHALQCERFHHHHTKGAFTYRRSWSRKQDEVLINSFSSCSCWNRCYRLVFKLLSICLCYERNFESVSFGMFKRKRVEHNDNFYRLTFDLYSTYVRLYWFDFESCSKCSCYFRIIFAKDNQTCARSNAAHILYEKT